MTKSDASKLVVSTGMNEATIEFGEEEKASTNEENTDGLSVQQLESIDELEREVANGMNDDADNEPKSLNGLLFLPKHSFGKARISFYTSLGIQNYVGYVSSFSAMESERHNFQLLFKPGDAFSILKMLSTRMTGDSKLGLKVSAKKQIRTLSRHKGITKRKRKIRNMKENNQIKKLDMIGVRIVRMSIQSDDRKQITFKSGWGRTFYNNRPLPDWTVRSASVLSTNDPIGPNGEKLILVEMITDGGML